MIEKSIVVKGLFLLIGIFLLSTLCACVTCIPSPVAKTGQTECYNNQGDIVECSGTGVDGDLQMGVAWPNPRFKDNGDGAVIDNLTGLMWEKKTLDNKDNTYSWQDALAYCENLSLAGYDDWRLPSINALPSLVDYTRFNPSINMAYFPNTMPSEYWSSTSLAGSTYSGWVIRFELGYVFAAFKSRDHHVRAVRGGQ